MSTMITWEGHRIDIKSRFVSKYLWFATETSVSVDGKEVACSGGFSFTESAIGEFNHDSQIRRIELQTSIGLSTTATCVLRIDGIAIWQGNVAVENMLVGVLSYVIFFLLLFGGLFLVF